MVEVKKKKVKEVSEPRELLCKSVSAVQQEEINYQIQKLKKEGKITFDCNSSLTAGHQNSANWSGTTLLPFNLSLWNDQLRCR